MKRRQVHCINKTDRYNAHERIRNVGGVENGTRWKMAQPEAIAAIEARTLQLYVSKNGHTVDVIVSKSAQGHKYLKTVADGDQPDNLLSLPECP